MHKSILCQIETILLATKRHTKNRLFFALLLIMNTRHYEKKARSRDAASPHLRHVCYHAIGTHTVL